MSDYSSRFGIQSGPFPVKLFSKDLFIKFCTKHSTVLVMYLVRNLMNKMLYCTWGKIS